MKAYELLDSEEKFTVGEYACDAKGYRIDPLDPKASKWCAVGAVCKTRGIFECDAEALIDSVIPHARLKKYKGFITKFSDDMGFEAARALLKEFDL
jgi:hypothetical protein